MLFLEFYNLVLKTTHVSSKELPFKLEKVHFSKGDIITDYGDIESKLYFINNGIVEMSIKSYMTEKIIDFFFKNEMLGAYTSFLTQLPSDVQIVALKDTEVEMIMRDDLMRAYDISLDINKFGRILTEQTYIRKANREKDFLIKTAEERYAELFATHSEFISYIPVNKIAKYLGIHPESLSRIRKNMNF